MVRLKVMNTSIPTAIHSAVSMPPTWRTRTTVKIATSHSTLTTGSSTSQTHAKREPNMRTMASRKRSLKACFSFIQASYRLLENDIKFHLSMISTVS